MSEIRDRDHSTTSGTNLRILLGRKDSNLQSPDPESGERPEHFSRDPEHDVGGRQTASPSQSGGLSPEDRLLVALARRGPLRIGQLWADVFGEAPHGPVEGPCLFHISDEDMVARIEGALDEREGG